MVQLSATRCSCIAIWWVSLVSFASITLCVSSQRAVTKVSVYYLSTQSGNFWIHPRIWGAGIAQRYRAGLRAGWSGVRVPVGAGNCCPHHRVQTGSGSPPIQWVPGALSLGVKRAGREADHSPPSSAEVKNAWSHISTIPIRLHGVVLSLKEKHKATLPLPYVQLYDVFVTDFWFRGMFKHLVLSIFTSWQSCNS
jgi:hypothetical protein